MSDTRKVTVTVTRYYSKQTEVEVDVPNEIGDDQIQDWLTENDDLTERVGHALDKAILYDDEDNWEFSDPENNNGGHL
jgi:hypothetical protein